MSLSSWRNFNFFEGAPIRDPSSGNEDNLLYSDTSLSAVCAADERVFFSVTKPEGVLVKAFNQDLGLVNSWVAYPKDWMVTYMKYIPGTHILITVAENLGSPVSVKLWSLRKLDKKTNQPKCQSTVTVMNGPNTHPISAFAISKESNILAFGYGDGSVILVRGDIIRDRGFRQRLIYNSKTPITGLAFHENPRGLVTLYVTTISKIITVSTNGKNEGKPDRILDNSKGANLGCVGLTDNGELLVGRDDALSYYTVNGHGPSIALSVPKKQLYFLNNKYIFIITSGRSSDTENGDNNNNNSLLAVDRSSVNNFFETTRLLIIDVQHKHIAFSSQISQAVKDVFMIWGDFYLLGTDGILYRIHERDINYQLDTLVQRDLYDLAIEIASAEPSVDDDEVLKIRKKYGDYLFNKGEFEAAMDNYVKSITPDGTSEVIIKYSDPSRINSLPKYLETLHELKLATKDHITLLFNCYTRLGDTTNLNKYIRTMHDSKILDFNAVVKICRQSGYFAEAAILAENYGENELAVKIKLNDIGNIKECLNFIVKLEAEDVLHIMINHSRVLLDSFPNETTAILIELFTGKYVPGMKIGNEITNKDETTSDNSSSITAPVMQSYRAFMSYMTPHLIGDEAAKEVETITSSKSYEPTYLPPQPRIIFPSFLNHPNEFIIFLEACISKFDYFGGNSKDKSDLLSTLFEMYLELASNASDPAEKAEWESKAKTLGKDFKSEMDITTLLLLSHLADFPEGQLLARDVDGYQLDIFRACVINSDTQGALDVLHKFGQDEKELYVIALSFFVSSQEIFNEVGEAELKNVLNTIRKEKLMSPLQVVQALAVNTVACIGTIRDYLLEIIKKEKTDIENNQLLRESYRAETETKRAEIVKLTTDPTTIQSTRCTGCNTTMDLPAVHFLCKHSYHQRCLNEPSILDSKHSRSTLQCPVCLPDMEAIKAITRSHEDISARHDLFKVSLEDSEMKFMTVTDFFGRGAIGQPGYV